MGKQCHTLFLGGSKITASELWEMVMDREARHAVIHGVAKSQTRLSDWTELKLKNKYSRDFPSGPVVKNPPANAADMGLIPGPGRCHMGEVGGK